jgi:two-component system response regulator DevR
MPGQRIKVAICDDHDLVRRGVRALLTTDLMIDVVGEASGADEALALCRTTSPNVVVMDVRMPGRSGIEATRDIRAENPDIRVLMLTSFADDDALFSSIMAGASGFVLKQVRGSDLLDAVHRVADGASLLDPAATARVMARLRGDAVEDGPEALTAQERRVLDLVAEGMTNRQIGERVHLAEKTVKNYVSSILMKLGLTRRAEVAAFMAKRRSRTGNEESWS